MSMKVSGSSMKVYNKFINISTAFNVKNDCSSSKKDGGI